MIPYLKNYDKSYTQIHILYYINLKANFEKIMMLRRTHKYTYFVLIYNLIKFEKNYEV